MRFSGPDGRRIHLAYCTNVHAGEDLQRVLEGLRDVSAPLRERVHPRGELGIGLYLPDVVARMLEASSRRFDELRDTLERGGLYVATLNAFPFGGFHAARVKEDVFRPAWTEAARCEHTLRCARLLARLAPSDVVPSLSTHTGGYRPWGRDKAFLDRVRDGLLAASRGLLELDRQVSLALEPEPDSTLESVAEVAGFLARALPAAERVGICLDTCHAAVLFETADAIELALGTPARVAKMQLSSALEVRRPADHPAAREELRAWSEPRWLHQVRGLRVDGALLAAPDLETWIPRAETAEWLACSAWRIHFHVPIFAESIGALATTRQSMIEQFERALDRDWTRVFEIETYTFDRLPQELRGDGDSIDLVRSLAREFEAAQRVLAGRGYRPE